MVRFNATLVSVFLLLSAHEGFAQAYAVTGRLQYRQATFKRGIYQGKQTEDYQFQAIVDGNKWFIHLTTTENRIVTYDYCEVGYDGESLYYLRSMKSWVQDQLAAGKTPGSNSATAIILRSPVPAISANHEIGPLWLAYASAPYYANLKSPMALCPLTRSIGPKGHTTTMDAYQQEVRASRGGFSPGIPRQVVFLETNMSGVAGTGLTNATFAILSYTNSGAWRLPLQSILRTYQFYREPGTSNAAVIVSDEYEMTTDSVGPGPRSTSFVPALPDLTHTSDLRFWHDTKLPLKVFHYFNLGSWYSESDARKLPEYKKAIGKAYPGTLALSARGAVRALLILVAFVVPAALFMLVKRRAAKGVQ